MKDTGRRTAPEYTFFIRLAVLGRITASEWPQNIWQPVFKRRPAYVRYLVIRHFFGKRHTAEQRHAPGRREFMHRRVWKETDRFILGGEKAVREPNDGDAFFIRSVFLRFK